jgi:hypothetical protein
MHCEQDRQRVADGCRDMGSRDRQVGEVSTVQKVSSRCVVSRTHGGWLMAAEAWDGQVVDC